MPLLKGFCFVLTRTFISSVRLDVFKHRNDKAEARISARKTRRGLISECVQSCCRYLKEFLGSTKTSKVGFVAVYPEGADPESHGA